MKKKKLNLLFLPKNKKVTSQLKRIMIFLIILAFLLIFFKQFMSFIITIALVVIASLSKIYKRLIHSIGFELVTFASIIFFFAHGPVLGFILALLMLLASTLISSRITQVFTFQIMIYAFLAVLSIFLRGFDIVTAAKILVVIYNILLHGVGLFIVHYPPHQSVINFIVNVATNFFFLEYTAQWLVSNL